jgi:hypothetical protein
LFLILALGAIDAAYLFFDWSMANKAVYLGARTAVISDPVDPSVNPSYTTAQLQKLGLPCFDRSTGGSNSNCPSISYVCAGPATCSTTQKFKDIVSSMQAVYCLGQSSPYTNCLLQPANVTVSYQSNGSGFVGEPDGLPLNVTVSIHGMTHTFFFVGPILSFFQGSISSTQSIPAFATTMQSEDMNSSNN